MVFHRYNCILHCHPPSSPMSFLTSPYIQFPFEMFFLNPRFHQPTRLHEKTAPLPLLIPGKSYMTYKETTLKETSPLPCIQRSKQPNFSPANRNRQYELNSANLETITLQFPVKAAVDRMRHCADLHPDMKLNATVPSSAVRPLCKHYLRKTIVSHRLSVCICS